MPQTLTLDDLAQYGAPAAPPPTTRTAAPAQKTLTLDDLAQYGAAPAAPKSAAAPQSKWWEPSLDPSHQSFLRSFYDEGLAPLVSTVVKVAQSDDLGQGVAKEILSSFYDQAKNFAAHPDIRNLPVIGTGATATAARMQRQYDAGNYAGMIGSALGFVGQFAAPEAAKAAYEKLPAVGKAAARAADATSQWADAAGEGVKAAAPDIGTGAAKVAGGALISRLLPAPELVRALTGLELGERAGAMQIGRGVKAGIDAYKGARAAQALADAADAATTAAPRVPLWQQAYDAADAASAAEAARPPTEPLWQDARAATAPAAAEEATAAAAAEAPASAVPLDARETLAPDVAAKADAVRAETHAATPALSDAQRLEDAIHQHAAYLRMQADDITWANRARKADRFAGYLIKNDLPATRENLARAAKELVERDVPSEETAQMIADRVDWHNARVKAGAPQAPEAPSELEQQLRDSIAAAAAQRVPQRMGAVQ